MSQQSVAGAASSPTGYAPYPRYPNQPTFQVASGAPAAHIPGSPSALPPQAAPVSDAKRHSASRDIFIGTGALVLLLICAVPLWNGIALLEDPNYSFWHGRTLPLALVLICAGVLVLYVVTVAAFFSCARPQAHSEQVIMMIANMFIIILGLALVLVSMPLSRQSLDTYSQLMAKCDFSVESHRLYEYSQVLHNIRRSTDCVEKYSVEECPGYEDAPPYTGLLKVMENNFHCSGFCYRNLQALPAAASGLIATHTAEAPGSAGGSASEPPPRRGGKAQEAQQRQRRHGAGGSLEPAAAAAPSLVQDSDAAAAAERLEFVHPPTLFSDNNWKASCEGMAARDIRNFGGDIAWQTFYQGIYLVLIAVAAGFLKLVGFCVRKDRHGSHPRAPY